MLWRLFIIRYQSDMNWKIVQKGSVPNCTVLWDDDGGFEGFGFFGGDLGVGDDYYGIAYGDQAGGSAVKADALGAALSTDNVGNQACAVGNINHVNLLTVNDAGCIPPVAVNSNAADIVDIGIGHLNAVKFGFEYSQ